MRKLDDTQVKMIDNEIEVLKRSSPHPHITSMHDMYRGKTMTYLVLELVSGGELFDKIIELQSYTEQNASKCIRELSEAVAHLHKLHIANRDVKPENILLSSAADDASIKLADFGLAHLEDVDGAKITQAVGTPGYLAPEIVDTLDSGVGYDHRCDLWAIGVIAYILLCGYPPFYADEDDKLLDIVQKGEYTFHDKWWSHISDQAKDLIRQLLQRDPSKRLSAKQILEHPWIVAPQAKAEIHEAQEELRKFKARLRLRKGIKAVMAARRLARGIGK